jgi:hypothetical protein
MSRQEIDQLVEEYNQVEIEQAERLKRLYRLVRARGGPGYRSVVFRHGVTWSNCWLEPERLILPGLTDQRIRTITGVTTVEPVGEGG